MASFVRRVVGLCRSVRSSPLLHQTPAISPPAPRHTPQLISAQTYTSYRDDQSQAPYAKLVNTTDNYKKKMYDGGVLPRPEGELADKPLKMPAWRPYNRDQWTQQKALFGQNDYIDILGDGTVNPADTIQGPNWLAGFKGNELQRLARRMHFQGAYLREMYPSTYHSLRKRQVFLYKRLNRRKHSNRWGAKRKSAKSRIQKVTDW